MKHLYYILPILFALILSCEKNKEPFNPISKEKVIFANDIEEYHFLKDQFFFADSFYMATYESSFDPQTMEWIPPNGGLNIINKLELWINTLPTSPNRILGIAAVNPDTINRDSIQHYNEVEGEIIRTFFERLVYPNDYHFDNEKGIIKLNQALKTTDVIGVSYQTAGGLKRGILGEDISPQNPNVVVKLIKPANLRPYYPTWDLVMRNVYDIGIRNVPERNLKIIVTYTSDETNIQIQPSNQKSFNYLLGLDRLNKDDEFIDGGDGYIDSQNENILDLSNGLLIFPSSTPFFPSPSSSFTIDDSFFVDIYSTVDTLIYVHEHKFNIKVAVTDTMNTN